jgi:hypothetical protein
MKKILLALVLAASAHSVSAQLSSCQFHISRHSGVSCQFSNVPVQPQVVYVNPPAWTQATVFTNPPPVVVYQEPQVIYVYPAPTTVYIAPGMRVPELPYQPNPFIPYYNPNPYPRHRH